MLSGSLTRGDEPGDAREFYAGLDVRPVDMTAALRRADPMRADPPMHPSYEDRPGAPDRVFASLDDDEYERQVVAWCRALQSVGAARADVLHLHHLTPIHEAAARVAPGVPVVGHLHGTELLMLEAIAAEPRRWAHAASWVERMRAWAAGCERVIVLSETQVARAEELLGLDPERCVLVPNGYDPVLFAPRHLDHAAHWRRHLVDEPGGWGPGGVRVAYDEADLAAFSDEEGETPVLLYVGRFTEVKRLPLLIEAYERARPGFARRAPLVIVGGFPGEWEGEHPLDAIRRDRRARTSSWPAGTATTSCPPSSPPPTSSCCRRCASSSARCSSRGWRAPCRRSPSTPGARPTSSATARRAGSSSPTTSSRWRTRWCTRSTARPSGAGAASAAPRWRASSTRGRRWRGEVAAVYDAACGRRRLSSCRSAGERQLRLGRAARSARRPPRAVWSRYASKTIPAEAVVST